MELHNLKQAVDKAKDRLFDAELRSPIRPSLRKEYAPSPRDVFTSGEGERRRSTPLVQEPEPDHRSPVDELVERWAAGLTVRTPERAPMPGDVEIARPLPVAPAKVARPTELEIEFTQTRRMAVNLQTLEDNRILNANTRPEVTAAFKMLRTQIVQKMRAQKWTSLGVITTRSGQGGSVTATNLAISLAQEVTQSVMLADFNFRKPGLHTLFGLSPQSGIGDYLFASMPLSNVLVCPSVDRLTLLPCTAPIDSGSLSLSAPRLLALVDELKSRYEQRLVIYDLPPALESDDVLAFAPHVDAVLLVVEESVTSQDDILEVAELLKGVPLIGTVLTKSRHPNH